ncbi:MULTISPECIES: hypothetical protein [unclassified Streptomyces]|uniref:hypothetical protein n=1 Tax=unclassified Streptomyces TaxID=2593676 RepID=UPI0033221F83
MISPPNVPLAQERWSPRLRSTLLVFCTVVTAVITGGSPQQVLDSFRPGLAVVTVVAAAGLLITLSGLRTRRPGGGVLVATSVPRTEPEGVAVGD